MWDARDSKRVGFRWEIADSRKHDVCVLAGPPADSATHGQTNRVRGEEFNCRERSILLVCNSVVPDETGDAEDAIESPDDKSRPDVVAESAFLDEYGCVARSKLDLPRVSRMDIATDEEDTRVRCKY